METSFQRAVGLFMPGAERAPAPGEESVSLNVDGQLAVDVADEGDGVLGFYCVVWEFPDEPPPWLLLDLGEANYGCAGTNGATLGVHRATRSVLLTRLWPFQEDAPEAAKLVFDVFVETALQFNRRFAARLRQLAAGAAVAQPGALPAETAPAAEAFSPSSLLKV